jgi:MYXO-CTERM domain-containing protein
VVITAPAAAATVPTTFTIKANVTDNVKVTKVEILADDKVVTSLTSAPYNSPVTLKAGIHLIKVVGYDAAGNKGDASVSVTVSSSGTGGTPSPDDPDTQDPGTQTPSTTGAGKFGATCEAPKDCQSNMCAHDNTLAQSFCTQTCTVSSISCPTGGVCSAANSGGYVCALEVTSGAAKTSSGNRSNGRSAEAMGCSVSASSPDTLLGLALCALLLLPLRRKR